MAFNQIPLGNSIKVKVGSQNTVKVKLGDDSATKVITSSLGVNAIYIDGISVDLNGIQDNYVLQYNASTNKITAVEPDSVIIDSATDGDGIPPEFINEIDLDGGTF